MEIAFTQFLMPDGRKRPMIIDRPDDIGEKARQLAVSGCRFEIEMLTTGQISMTVERDRSDGEVDVLACEICSNGPPVLIAVDKLISEAATAGVG